MRFEERQGYVLDENTNTVRAWCIQYMYYPHVLCTRLPQKLNQSQSRLLSRFFLFRDTHVWAYFLKLNPHVFRMLNLIRPTVESKRGELRKVLGFHIIPILHKPRNFWPQTFTLTPQKIVCCPFRKTTFPEQSCRKKFRRLKFLCIRSSLALSSLSLIFAEKLH